MSILVSVFAHLWSISVRKSPRSRIAGSIDFKRSHPLFHSDPTYKVCEPLDSGVWWRHFMLGKLTGQRDKEKPGFRKALTSTAGQGVVGKCPDSPQVPGSPRQQDCYLQTPVSDPFNVTSPTQWHTWQGTRSPVFSTAPTEPAALPSLHRRTKEEGGEGKEAGLDRWRSVAHCP